ncbi:MAG: sigma-70 family RNA polymerase sigma factor, partial [Bacteroidales bacterium]|nr:sigma-70 family RNA polymerase sigma factor [Bacteroidales bacterium]
LFRQELAAEAAEENSIGQEISNCKEPPQYSVDSIKKALLLLPDGYRLILSLHLFEGYDYEEISQITGLKESSISSQYLRAKKRLTEIISNREKL